MRVSKWLSTLLAVLLLLGQFSGALAQEADYPTVGGAAQAGREVSYSAKAQWYGLPLLPEEANTLIASVVNAFELKGTSAVIDEQNLYSSLKILLGGAEVLPMATVMKDGVSYTVSPVCGPTAVAIAPDEVAPFLDNLMVFLAQSTGEDTAAYEGLFSGIAAGMEAASQEGLSVDMQDMEALVTAISVWAEAALKTEPYGSGEEFFSVFGVEADYAEGCELTKAEVTDLLAIVYETFSQADSYWQSLANAIAQMEGVDFGDLTPEEAAEEVKAAFEILVGELSSSIPEDFAMTYTEYFAMDGEQVSATVAGGFTIEADAISMYLEWLAGETALYFEMGDGATNAQFYLQKADDVVTETEAGRTTSERLDAELMLLDGETPMMDLMLNIVADTTETDGGRQRTGSVTLGMTQQGSTVAAKILVEEDTAYAGVDVATDTAVTFSLLFDEVEMPIAGVLVSVSTGEPQGQPFDPAAEGFTAVHPGQMDAETFAAWFQQDMMTGAMQTMLTVLGKLPPDVFGMFMYTDSTDFFTETEAPVALP